MKQLKDREVVRNEQGIFEIRNKELMVSVGQRCPEQFAAIIKLVQKQQEEKKIERAQTIEATKQQQEARREEALCLI